MIDGESVRCLPKIPCSSNGTKLESSPVTCWSRRTNAFNETPKTFPSSLRFRLNGFRLSNATLCRSKIDANSSHSNGCSFFKSFSFNSAISQPVSVYSCSFHSCWSSSLLRHRFSKLTGSGLARRHDVDETTALLKRLCRNGELAGLCSGVDVFDDESSGELLLYRLLWLRAPDMWAPLWRLRKIKLKISLLAYWKWMWRDK